MNRKVEIFQSFFIVLLLIIISILMIFLVALRASDELWNFQNIYKMFKDKFGDILLENKQYMFSDTDDKFIADIKVARPNHAYTLAMEYLASIYIISKCKYIIGGVVTATLGAWFLSEGFKDQHYVYLWDLGRYGITERVACKNIFEKMLSVRNEYFEDKKYKVITILGKDFKSPIRKRVKNYIKSAYTNLP